MPTKKLFVTISFTLLTALAAPALAGNRSWTNGSGDGLWSTASNWSPSGVPVIGLDKAVINKLSGPLISSGMAAEAQLIALSDGAPGALLMTGGTLNVGEEPNDSWFIVAYGTSDVGTFTLDGGAVTTSNRVFVGFKGHGTVVMNGGTFNIGGMFGIGFCDANSTTGEGYVYLNGGTITAAQFQMRYPTGTFGLLDITNGTLVINGDQTALIQNYVNNSWITAFGGTGTVDVDYNVTNPGKTTVTAYLDLAKAGNPSPTNGIDDVLPNAILSWSAGIGAISHDVYFGTSDPPAFIGNQTETTFDPCGLDLDTLYYWRIDEVNGSNTVTGDLWTFTTITGLATNPNPANGVSNVPLSKVLSWDAGYGAASHDVYLGKDAVGVEAAERPAGDLDGDGEVDYDDLFTLTDYWLADPAGSEPYAGVNDDDIVDFTDYAMLAANYKGQPSPWCKGNIGDTSYDDPCDFEFETTYYWRVDEVNGPERLKGDLWSFTTTASDSNYTLVGKVMCGYQGWFNCPGDGIPRGWVHWGTYLDGGTFTPTECTVDMWPDMTEMGPGEKFLADAFYDGTDHYVFSSHNYDTVVRHFQWMDDYGIDGIYLQRFATETTPGTPWCDHRNDVLSYCKAGANLYGKKYAVMYDLSGLGAGEISKVIYDWMFLVDVMQVGRDPADMGYMFHNGKPVVAVWGLGFGRAYEGQESYDLIDFLKNDPTYGGNVVMLGVNNDWRTNPDSWFQQTLQLADIISPWWVGRFGNTGEAYNFASTVGVPDKAWCDSNGKEYLPVLFPGFSWYNMHDGSTPFNQIPRNGGQFLWDQVYCHINTVGATMLYIAMFDEVDEGTAIFKVTNDPPEVLPARFVTYDIDGYPLPSDEYLWLVGQAARALRGEIPANQTRPVR